MRTALPRRTAAVAAALALALAGCSSSTGSGSAASSAPPRTLTVFAAASMTSTFKELGKTFEQQNPGVSVTFNFAGSQALAQQITNGAQADVFASANQTNMKTVTDANLASGPAKVYATNVLEIVVPKGNPAGIASFQDLAKPDLKLVICAASVPCGAATQNVEKATGVTLKPVSEEQAVTDVLTKVRSGQADAGLVYKTDVISAGDQVQGVPFPESSKAVNTNYIVALKDAPQGELAGEFVDLVLGDAGQQVLKKAGFGQPATASAAASASKSS
ncbi:molybdate transport system substrate-binding protein [Propionibacterium cyclohexanicum]|uniref:Molybdate transport system substrate-binding protein n=1 Tax=Propionibacterium cyclohexanicum TaxID=64702 RepID=A0A1H9TYU4_9ACTN|nr:molybdate ABC transporter substrate-binding protein [Propionibacterium cyclohexanicum]SES02286.1 molybdate transport system substrate-binding protein [Propionibacterium cyclohexanicum]